MRAEPVTRLDNARALVTGGVGQLCRAAVEACVRRGYEAELLTDRLCCEAREAGAFLGCVAAAHARDGRRLAYVAGGETVVHLRGAGKGGRNQELALAAAQQIAGIGNAAVLALGSDGTDGPTDAAGGVVDGASRALLEAQRPAHPRHTRRKRRLPRPRGLRRPARHRADRHQRQRRQRRPYRRLNNAAPPPGSSSRRGRFACRVRQRAASSSATGTLSS